MRGQTGRGASAREHRHLGWEGKWWGDRQQVAKGGDGAMLPATPLLAPVPLLALLQQQRRQI